MPRLRRPEAALIVNPSAGRLSETARAEVVQAVSDHFDVRILTTQDRGAGFDLADGVVKEGCPLVIAFGGDGHVNEVANAAAGTTTAVGLLPGGTMNVFARALGVPVDPMEAVVHLQRRAAAPARRVPLGKLDDRFFTFAAGCGFDAEAAGRVERNVTGKRWIGEMFFYWSAFRVLAGSYRRRHPHLRISGEFGEINAAMAIASNVGPYAYFLGRPVDLTPNVDLEGGLDLFALTSMRLEALPEYVWKVVLGGPFSGHRDARCEHDLEKFEVTSLEPFARHVDGEPLGTSTTASFAVVRDALRVVA
jgi:diacylglycerol kinase family enzyme